MSMFKHFVEGVASGIVSVVSERSGPRRRQCGDDLLPAAWLVDR